MENNEPVQQAPKSKNAGCLIVMVVFVVIFFTMCSGSCSGSKEEIDANYKKMQICSVEGCNNRRTHLDVCDKHYQMIKDLEGMGYFD